MMKRRRIHRDIRLYAHPKGKMKQELSKFQLMAIGAVALAYNELAVTVDTLLLLVAGSQSEDSTSTNNTDAIEHITGHIADAGLEREDQKQLIEALDAFRDSTTYRDVINHVRIMNLVGVVELSPKSRKAKLNTPFSDRAINIFYDHLIALEKELSSAVMLVQSISMLRPLAIDDPKRSFYIEGMRACCLQFRGYGMRRRTLKPIRQFPAEVELRDARAKWREAQQAETLAWLTAWADARGSVEVGTRR